MRRSFEPDVPAPQTDHDRAYLVMMYQEHAEHARLHETLRAAVTSLLMALIAGLLATSGGEKHPRIVGGVICAVSMFGMILNAKHYEKYRLHIDVMRGFRTALEKNTSAGIANINNRWRDYYKTKRGYIRYTRLNQLWYLIYVFTFATGIAFIFITV